MSGTQVVVREGGGGRVEFELIAPLFNDRPVTSI